MVFTFAITEPHHRKCQSCCSSARSGRHLVGPGLRMRTPLPSVGIPPPTPPPPCAACADGGGGPPPSYELNGEERGLKGWVEGACQLLQLSLSNHHPTLPRQGATPPLPVRASAAVGGWAIHWGGGGRERAHMALLDTHDHRESGHKSGGRVCFEFW